MFHAMPPHLSAAELDLIVQSTGHQKATKDIYALISAKRRARKLDPPKIWAIRRAVRGSTHLRGWATAAGRWPGNYNNNAIKKSGSEL